MHQLLQQAGTLQSKMVAYRRHLHTNAELGMHTVGTARFIKETLEAMGYEPKILAEAGVVAMVGGHKPGPVILLRADTDALPIQEEADVEFRCSTGQMHACGHDLHTAMLLGAAEILKNMEASIEGTIKLMFQPAEETLEGAKAMIDAGVLKNPEVDGAMMIHVATGFPVPTGAVIVPDQEGPFMAAADWFDIKIHGKGGHGAMPEFTVDPLNIAAHTHIALQVINAREVERTEPLAMTIGRMQGGQINNVIPDTAELSGTIRTFTEKTQLFVHKRIKEIAEGVAITFGGRAEVTIKKGVPAFKADGALTQKVISGLGDMLPKGAVIPLSSIFSSGKVMGSEDFAFISHLLPTTQVSVAAGNSAEGFIYPLHHPKAKFDEKALTIGAATYVNSALSMLSL